MANIHEIEIIDIADDDSDIEILNIEDNDGNNINRHRNVVDMFHQMNDEDALGIVDEFHENALDAINFEHIMDEDEESMLSDDSQYISDCDDFRETIAEKHLMPEEVRAITGQKKHCAIYFFYTTGGTYSACAECIMRIADTDFNMMTAFRKHMTDTFDMLDGKYCSNCRQPMFVIIPYDMCPVCAQ